MTATARVDLPVGLIPADFVTLPSGARLPACRAKVQLRNRTILVTLLMAQPGEQAPSDPELATLSAADPAGAVVVGLEATGTGQATVTAPVAAESSAEAVVLAAAVCTVSWGWDESPEILVTLNGRASAVSAVYRDEAWFATITEARAAPATPQRPWYARHVAT